MSLRNDLASSLVSGREKQLKLLGDRLGALGDAHPVASLAKSLIDPLAIVAVLYALAKNFAVDGSVLELMGILAFLLASLTLDNTLLLLPESRGRWLGLGKMVYSWLWFSLLVVAVCRVADVEQTFSAPFIATWLVSAFVLCVLLHYGFRLWVMYAGGGQESLRRVLIVGATSSGRMLAQRIGTNGQLGLDFIGYIDDRMDARIVDSQKAAPLGNLQDLPRIVQQQNIHRVYVSLPMCSQQRILNLVETLKDSTVSLYFIPDLIVFDLIQARVDHVAGLPVLAVCESPFVGLNRFIKRTEDLVLASLILLLIWPLLLLVALMVKLTSPGPVIFVQRRYGMDGRPIDIFKFRSMFVQESGAGESFKQAQKNDARLTPIGAFIRKTSLDELPQFFNVLGGSMSIVGPRPHVHALDQLYRSQIKGYMQRNKVKPGITGWAQVNGSRGETAGLEPMRRRIEYDLDYLRDWSLWVDLKIIAMTLLVLIRDPNAY